MKVILQFDGQCPLTMRYQLRRSNSILWTFPTGRYDPLGV